MLAQSRENNDFQLHTLGWKSFQDLCSTITAEILGQTIQQFLPTKDAGRDGAFSGAWNGKEDQKFVVQCKFFGDPSKILKAAHLQDEIPKARRLAKKKQCDRYLIISNAVVTGGNASASFLSVQSIRRVFTSSEIRVVVRSFADRFLLNFERRIEVWGDGREKNDDAREFFSPIRDGLRAISSTFPRKYLEQVRAAEDALEVAIDAAEYDERFSWDDEDEDSSSQRPAENAQISDRDIFDDVDD